VTDNALQGGISGFLILSMFMGVSMDHCCRVYVDRYLQSTTSAAIVCTHLHQPEYELWLRQPVIYLPNKLLSPMRPEQPPYISQRQQLLTHPNYPPSRPEALFVTPPYLQHVTFQVDLPEKRAYLREMQQQQQQGPPLPPPCTDLVLLGALAPWATVWGVGVPGL
jgi:hypothetical protein